MKSTENKFPIFRKYVGVETYFKIVNEKEFIEIKKVGSRFLNHHIVASQFPEIQFIKDMIDRHENRWEEINEETFRKIQSLTA